VQLVSEVEHRTIGLAVRVAPLWITYAQDLLVGYPKLAGKAHVVAKHVLGARAPANPQDYEFARARRDFVAKQQSIEYPLETSRGRRTVEQAAKNVRRSQGTVDPEPLAEPIHH
jgi:hypothetical protein